MTFVVNQMRQLFLGSVCLSAIILMQASCASIVFDELSDKRDGGGGSATSSGNLPSGTFVSGAKFGQSGDQLVQGATMDAQGRVVVTGMNLSSSLQDLGCNVGSKGGLDIFATYIDPDELKPVCPASHLFGSAKNDVPLAIATNPKLGGVAIVGFSMGDFDCGNGSLPNQGGRDVVVTEFVGDACSWQQSFGGLEDQEGRAITFDSVGNAYIGGRFKGTVEFEEPNPNAADGFDAYIAKLTFGTGNPAFSMRALGAGDQEVQALVAHTDKALIVGGKFSETLDFQGSQPLSISQPGQEALFVASLDVAAKTVAWQKKVAQGALQDTRLSLAVAPDGDIFIAGGFRSGILFPDASANESACKQDNPTPEDDIFVAKLTINGECLWSRRIGEINPALADLQRAYAIAVDAASNVYVTGEFRGSIVFDAAHQVESAGNTDAFVLKLDGAGDYVWSKVLAGTGSESGQAVALDASGAFVFVVGSFKDSSLNLAGEWFTPTDLDVFLAKFAR